MLLIGLWGFPGGSVVKCRRRRRQRFSLCIEKSPWRRKWQPSTVFLPGKSHGQRSLVDYGS